MTAKITPKIKSSLDDICHRLRVRMTVLVLGRKTETVIMLMFAGFLASLGFFSADVVNPNYASMYEFASQYFWAGLFFVYSSVKLLSLFLDLNFWIKMANGVVGLWAWTYILLSFTIFDVTPIAPTEALLALPVLTQSWLTLSTLYWGRK